MWVCSHLSVSVLHPGSLSPFSGPLLLPLSPCPLPLGSPSLNPCPLSLGLSSSLSGPLFPSPNVSFGLYLELGLDFPRFPSGQNLDVTRDLEGVAKEETQARATHLSGSLPLSSLRAPHGAAGTWDTTHPTCSPSQEYADTDATKKVTLLTHTSDLQTQQIWVSFSLPTLLALAPWFSSPGSHTTAKRAGPNRHTACSQGCQADRQKHVNQILFEPEPAHTSMALRRQACPRQKPTSQS